MNRPYPKLYAACASLLLMCWGTASWASDPASSDARPQENVSAWLAFKNARGEESLIRGDINHPTANSAFRIIPDVGALGLDEQRLQLGFELFNERRLSRDGSISCSTCHVGLLGGVDRQPVSFGVDSAKGTLNAPTIFNAALNFRQFWDGRSLNLQEQALEPIKNPAEFDHDLASAVAVLKAIPEYVSAFNDLYDDGITADNLGSAIAYYETMNFTGMDSPFLRMLAGEENELSRRARRGQRRFLEVGCASCHNGVNLGGNSYQLLGAASAWFNTDNPADENDDGLFTRTGREQDQHVFKVPTLHSVANTGPWMHDGSVASLHQAVDRMARHQSGRYLEDHDIDDIVSFLRSMGDSMGMLGDCAVGGNYGVTLDCDVKRRSADPEQRIEATHNESLDANRLDRQHIDAYQLAKEKVNSAPNKIAFEIQRIRTGEVAHFDFLQYEHIEMLRHARALAFPPASLSEAERDAALDEASVWIQTAEEYELRISDFLRSHATSLNAKTNYLDLLRLFSLEADEEAQALLDQAESSVYAYYANPEFANQEALQNATQALEGLNLHPDRFAELLLQTAILERSMPDLLVKSQSGD